MVNQMLIRFVSGEVDEDSHVYEDEAQILAEPFADIRRVL